MASVGLRPRHNVDKPSFLAILRKPSRVELNERRWLCSAAHSDISISSKVAVGVEEEATQNWLWLGTQKTSRQQAVTPRLGGRRSNDRVECEAEDEA